MFSHLEQICDIEIAKKISAITSERQMLQMAVKKMIIIITCFIGFRYLFSAQDDVCILDNWGFKGGSASFSTVQKLLLIGPTLP